MFFVDSCSNIHTGVEFISVETQASRLALVVKRIFFSDLELNNIAEV